MKRILLLLTFILLVPSMYLTEAYGENTGELQCQCLDFNGVIKENSSGTSCCDGNRCEPFPGCRVAKEDGTPTPTPTPRPTVAVYKKDSRATHGICISSTEKNQDKMHIGCMTTVGKSDKGQSTSFRSIKNWKDIRTSKLGRSDLDPSLATDGDRWCMVSSGGSNNKLFIGCTNPGKDPMQNSNWTSMKAKELGKSSRRAAIAYANGIWCVSSHGGSSKKIYLGCTKRIGDDPMKNSNWKGVRLKAAGESDHSTAIASDGKRWCVSSSTKNSHKVHLACTTQIAKHPLYSKWNDVYLSKVGKSSLDVDLATDGKRWCITGTTNGTNKIHVACTKDMNKSPLIKENWKDIRVKKLGETYRPPRIATDGVQWCVSSTGGSNEKIWIGCTLAYADPLINSNWNGKNLEPRLGETMRTPSIAMAKSCYHAGEVPPSGSEQYCCNDLVVIGGRCSVKEEEVESVDPANAHLYSITGTKYNAKVEESALEYWSKTDQTMIVFEALFTSFPKFEGEPTTSVEALNMAAFYRRDKYQAAKKWLDGKLAEIEEAAKINTKLKDLVKSNAENIPLRTPLVEKMQELLNVNCNGSPCNLEEFQSAALIIMIASKQRLYEFFNKLAEISMEFDKMLFKAKMISANEDWVCQKAHLRYCGSWRIFNKRNTIGSIGSYYIDPILPPQYINDSAITDVFLTENKKYSMTRVVPKFLAELKKAMIKDPHYVNFIDSYGKESTIENIGESAFNMMRIYSSLLAAFADPTEPVSGEGLGDVYEIYPEIADRLPGGRTKMSVVMQENNIDAISYYKTMMDLMDLHAESLYESYKNFEDGNGGSGGGHGGDGNDEYTGGSGNGKGYDGEDKNPEELLKNKSKFIGEHSISVNGFNLDTGTSGNGIFSSSNRFGGGNLHGGTTAGLAAMSKRLKKNSDAYKVTLAKDPAAAKAFAKVHKAFKANLNSSISYGKNNSGGASGGKSSSVLGESSSDNMASANREKKDDASGIKGGGIYSNRRRDRDGSSRDYGDGNLSGLSDEETKNIMANIGDRYKPNTGDTLWSRVTKAYVRTYDRVLLKKGSRKKAKEAKERIGIDLSNPIEIE